MSCSCKSDLYTSIIFDYDVLFSFYFSNLFSFGWPCYFNFFGKGVVGSCLIEIVMASCGYEGATKASDVR